LEVALSGTTSNRSIRDQRRWPRSVSALSHTWFRDDLLALEHTRRVEPFESAAAMVSEDLRHSLRREYDTRVEAWTKRWSRVYFDHGLTTLINQMLKADAHVGFPHVLLVPLLIVFFAARRWLGFGTTAALQRTLRNRCCPDCGYDLVTVKPAFEPSMLHVIGPRACPECGSPWPLVPPPNAGEPMP
jgi:hypothetical protein